MKVLVLRHGGSIDNFEMMEIEKPEIKDTEVLVKVHTVSLNPSDYQTAEFMEELPAPVVLGIDVAGEIVAVGKKVNRFSVGQRVFYLRRIDNPNGGFAEYAVSDEKYLCEIPKEMSYTQAAVLPGAGMTAWHIMYDRLLLREGKTILIHGGAGGVGSYLLQMAKYEGLKVITTCSERNFDYVKRLGADYVIDYHAKDVYNQVLSLTGNLGVDYVVNTVSSASATEDLKVMKFGSALAAVAGMPDLSGWKFYDKGMTVHEIAFGGYLTCPDEDLQKVPEKTGAALSKMVSTGCIQVPKLCEIDFTEIPYYLHKMKEHQVSGKIVAKICD